MHITPQHQELLERHQKLVMKSMQFEQILQQRDEQIQQLQSQITPLKEMVEQLMQTVKQQQDENARLVKLIAEKDKQLQKFELLQYQYDQLQRLVYSRSTEKSTSAPPDELSVTNTSG